MANKRKRARRGHGLVSGYLERISSDVFSDYPQQLTALVERQHGIYALYHGNKLYYVGLASNLRGRIKHHLRDRHAGKWDRFSLYLIQKADHIKELESLSLKISAPKGNRFGGKFAHAENLSHKLKKKIEEAHDNWLDNILGFKFRIRARRRRRRPRDSDTSKEAPLAPYAKGGFPIRTLYKGRLYKAKVLADGRVRFNGRIYNSPSAAGSAAKKGKATDGWFFWKFRNATGEWVVLDELRK